MDHITDPDKLYLIWLGRCTESWAKIEFLLETMVIIFHYTHRHREHQPKLPIALTGKVKYLRNSFGRYQLSKDGETQILAALDDVVEEAQGRHDLTHGIAINPRYGMGEKTIIRTVYENGGFRQKQIVANVDTLSATAMRYQNLESRLLPWPGRLDSRFVRPVDI